MPEAGGAVGAGNAEPSAPDPARSPLVVREVLLGRHGPYGDPRMAVDALDDIETWVGELDVDGVVALAAVLVELISDSDAVVATGAVLALDIVRRRQASAAQRLADVVATMIDLALTGGPSLDRAPIGFNGASQATLRGELAVIAARSATPAAIAGVTALVERAASIGVTRVDLVAALAEQLPALVVAHARAWVDPCDSAVIARLRDHHHRVAVATAARPWDDKALRAIETAGQWQHWHEAEIDALLRVMRDEAPELTAPRGVGDVDLTGTWWIVAESAWDWTLWRCDDGRAVLERVEGGVGMWTSLQVVSEDIAAAHVATATAGANL